MIHKSDLSDDELFDLYLKDELFELYLKDAKQPFKG